MLNYSQESKVYLKKTLQEEIIEHCLRKLSRNFLEHETPEMQAYGLFGAEIGGNGTIADIKRVHICRNNFRNASGVKGHINHLVENYAIPAETLIDERGWVVQPEELLEAYTQFEGAGLVLVGSYHMHHENSWQGDVPKEYPSPFDAKLAEHSGMLMFIVSIREERHYSTKVFYEGLKEKEIEVILC